MISKFGFSGLVFAAAIAAQCPQNSCSDALLQNPAAAASFCQVYAKHEQAGQNQSLPNGVCGAKGDTCVCASSTLPYPEFASPCFTDVNFAASLKSACGCVSGTPAQGSFPGSSSPSQGGSSPGSSQGSSYPGSNGSPSQGSSSPGNNGSLSQGSSSPGNNGSPSQGSSSPGNNSSPSQGSSSPGTNGSPSKGSSSPIGPGSSPSKGPITTQSSVTTEM